MQIGKATIFCVVWCTKAQFKKMSKTKLRKNRGVLPLGRYFFSRPVIQAVKAALPISVNILVNPLVSLLMSNGHLIVLICNTSRSVDRFSLLFML